MTINASLIAFACFLLATLAFLCLWAGWATDINRLAAGLFFTALGLVFSAAAGSVWVHRA